MREREHGPTKGVSPRDYPPAVVEQVRDLYESGMTQAEVQAEIGPGVKVQNVMRRYGIQARPAQARVAAAGENGSMWKRYEVKKGKTPPVGFRAANEPDPVTGKTQGWLPVGDGCNPWKVFRP